MDGQEIWKSEIRPSEFRSISLGWSELGMLPNARVTAFTVFELLTENQQGGGITPPPHRPTPPGLGLMLIQKII